MKKCKNYVVVFFVMMFPISLMPMQPPGSGAGGGAAAVVGGAVGGGVDPLWVLCGALGFLTGYLWYTNDEKEKRIADIQKDLELCNQRIKEVEKFTPIYYARSQNNSTVFKDSAKEMEKFTPLYYAVMSQNNTELKKLIDSN